MLQRIGEIVYNRYRAYLRRRRDPVREMYGDALPAPLEPSRRALVRRYTAEIYTGVIIGVVLAGVIDWQAQREELSEAEYWQASAEYWALSDDYNVVHANEMRRRGFSQEEIGRAEAAAFAESVFGGEERGPDLPAPRDPATLEIGDQLNHAQARSEALLRETDIGL